VLFVHSGGGGDVNSLRKRGQ